MGVTEFFEFLGRNGIDFRRCDHPAVYTVEEAVRLVPPLPGAKTKNLFLRDKPGRRHFLVCVPAAKQVELRALSDAIGSGRLSFGSSDRLMARLGVESGAVTLLAVFNDPERTVELFVDEELWAHAAFQFHPLVNTSTLVVSREAVTRFLELIGCPLRVIAVPGQESK
jgi:Ala-tRNA(Pro) deacylase